MIVWALTLPALGLQTFGSSISIRMVLQLLPAMAHVAVESILAPEFVVVDVVLEFPVEAGDGLVAVEGRVAAVVLQVVRVYAQCLVVLGQVKRAELGFVVEHVEILIVFVIMDEFAPDLGFTVREGAKLLILALVNILRVMRTELLLVGLILVELLDSGVRFGALVPTWALLAMTDVLAHVVGVEGAVSLAVLGVVVVGAELVSVGLGVGARVQLEVVQVQVLSQARGTFTGWQLPSKKLRLLACVTLVITSLFYLSFRFSALVGVLVFMIIVQSDLLIRHNYRQFPSTDVKRALVWTGEVLVNGYTKMNVVLVFSEFCNECSWPEPIRN